MYRLLKLRRFPNSQAISSSVSNNLLTRTCAFCNHNFVICYPGEVTSSVSNYSARNQSTNAANINSSTIIQVKKKKRKARKKYAELLEVSENSSIQKKASVSKLTSKHLSLLAQQPDIDLNKLFQLKKPLLNEDKTVSKTCPLSDDPEVVLFVPTQINANLIHNCVQNSPAPKVYQSSLENESCADLLQSTDKIVISSKTPDFVSVEHSVNETNSVNHDLETVPENMLSDLEATINDSVLRTKLIEGIEPVSYPSISSIKEEALDHFEDNELEMVQTQSEKEKKPTGNRKKKNTKDQNITLKYQEMETAGRLEALTQNLMSYLDACVNCGLLSRGLSALYFYRSRRKKSTMVADVRLYNIILSAFAKRGNLIRVKEILRLMDEDNLEWTLQTYASAFECLGRSEQNLSQMGIMSQWCEKLHNSGWTLNDVVVKNMFVNDQQKMALKAIQRMSPNFEPTYPPPDSCYSCRLLQELNVPEKKNISYKSPGQGIINLRKLKAAAKQQIDLEFSDQVKVKSIEKRNDDPKVVEYYRQNLKESEILWRETLTKAIKREMDVLQVQDQTYGNQVHLNLYPFLRLLSVEQLVEILMKEIRTLAEGSETFSPTTIGLHRRLGCSVLAKYELQSKQRSGVLDKVQSIYHKYCEWYCNPSGTAQNPREQWQLLVHSNNSSGSSLDAGKKNWSNVILCSVGKFLYNIILRDIKVNVNIMKPAVDTQHFLPAFYMVFRNHGHAMKEEIKPHPALVRLYRGAALDDLVFDTSLVPMLSPPVPWTSVSSCVGAYVLVQPDLVRLPFLAYQQRLNMEQSDPKQLYPSMDALNQLGSVPWSVNERVLDVVIEVFNNGGSNQLDIPVHPSAFTQLPSLTADMSSAERAKAFRERLIYKKKRSEMYSLWCDALYKLSLANHFRKRTFWLPHNMDFRGRVYPCPPHLNHMSSDMSRSLLQFAQPQPLGPKGLDWLMIHLINLTGLMKSDSVQDRLEYARSILPDILDSAKSPLTGKMWWAANEEPWQVLATCMEIEQAVESGDPENYMCRFPVHQDGSCNGLQHYAALGRDKAGGESVNLTPNTHPQDVYSSVAALVEKERAKDAAEGVKIAQILDGYVRRKVIKQTVMTTVYGVTRYGARLQIARQLRDINEFPKEFVWSASTYLVSKTFYTLREMFTSTKEIQDWFTECARQISQTCVRNVEWVTPLGLPIVQPYVRFQSKSEEVLKGQKLSERFTMDMFEKPNVMKQKNAFPPNFIHSLDSCHMMMTSIYSEREGITFVSVHDCFWTHPCSVEIMNKICREKFVALHSEPILEELSEFLLKKFGFNNRKGEACDSGLMLNALLKRIPKKGNLDLNDVLDSIYFFS